MKKFDIEKAKAGNPIVTRDGQEITNLIFNLNFQSGKKIAGTRAYDDGFHGLICFYNDGTFKAIDECNLDLFMAPIKKQGWVNICRNELRDAFANDIHATSDEAIRLKPSNCVDTVMIKWEE